VIVTVAVAPLTSVVAFFHVDFVIVIVVVVVIVVF